VRVGQVHFDERYAGAQQRVAQRNAGVREGARVDDHERHSFGAGPMDAIDQLVFGRYSGTQSARARARGPPPAERFSIDSSVSVPYTAGSRVPSRLRFGPFNNSTRAMGGDFFVSRLSEPARM